MGSIDKIAYQTFCKITEPINVRDISLAVTPSLNMTRKVAVH